MNWEHKLSSTSGGTTLSFIFSFKTVACSHSTEDNKNRNVDLSSLLALSTVRNVAQTHLLWMSSSAVEVTSRALWIQVGASTGQQFPYWKFAETEFNYGTESCGALLEEYTHLTSRGCWDRQRCITVRTAVISRCYKCLLNLSFCPSRQFLMDNCGICISRRLSTCSIILTK